MAASACAGAVGLAAGLDPYLRHLTDQLPFHSPAFGGLALAAIVGVPHTVVARYAWRADRRADSSAVVAGSLLISWIALEARVLEERSWLEPLYVGIGLLMVLAGRRWLSQREPAVVRVYSRLR